MIARTQQFSLYAAEAAVPDKGRRFSSVAEIQRYVDDIGQLHWFAETYPMISWVEVRDVRRSSVDGSVGGYDNEHRCGFMEMWSGHWVENYILHELSHVLAAAKWESQSHDPAFARTFLELVFRMRGTDAWLELRTRFQEAGIVWDTDQQ